jgi:hypothetical protein
LRQGAVHTTLTVLSGGVYHVELRASRAFDFKVSVEAAHGNGLTLRIHAEGAGVHKFAVKTQNLKLHEQSTQTIELSAGHDAELVIHADILSSGTPWVIVVIPDGTLSAHREVTGISGIQK